MKQNNGFRGLHTVRVLAVTIIMGAGSATVSRASDEPELSLAIRQKNTVQVQKLLTAGADVNERDEGVEQTPLMRAVQVQDVSLVRLLLAHGAQVNAQDDMGNTALILAAQQGNAPITQLLLQHGAAPGLPNAQGEPALSLARQKGYTNVVRLLSKTTVTSRIARMTPRRALSNRPVLTLR